jgi:hypothetical protein
LDKAVFLFKYSLVLVCFNFPARVQWMVSLIGLLTYLLVIMYNYVNSGVKGNSVLGFVHCPIFFSLYGNDYFRSPFYLLGRIERNEIPTLLGL